MLPGKALPVALAIRFAHGLQRKSSDIVVADHLVDFIIPMNRKTRYRALKDLERAGLIAVVRRKGAAPRVAIVEEEARRGKSSP